MSSNETITSRENLKSRIIPQMKLGTPSTTPFSSNPSKSHNAADPAKSRFSIDGNAALTGGAGTLALVASRSLLQHGLSGLVIMDLASSLDSSKGTIDLLIQDFPDAKILTTAMDVTDQKEVDDAFVIAKEGLGSIDMLLCFAGVVDTTPALELSVAKFRKTLDINTTGTFLCAQAAAKMMVDQKTGGNILFIAS